MCAWILLAFVSRRSTPLFPNLFNVARDTKWRRRLFRNRFVCAVWFVYFFTFIWKYVFLLPYFDQYTYLSVGIWFAVTYLLSFIHSMFLFICLGTRFEHCYTSDDLLAWIVISNALTFLIFIRILFFSCCSFKCNSIL